MKYSIGIYACAVGLAVPLWAGTQPAQAQAPVQKPNIILILSDDFGYGDAGAYGGGENRGMPTPSLDRLAAEGMQFMSFYAQPSCTPGRAAVQTGRIPNRSGMTTVAFQGQGGGLPAAEASGRRTMALGRTSIPMPATRRSAAPKEPFARAAIAFRPSPGGLVSRRERGILTLSAVWITWRRSPSSPA